MQKLFYHYYFLKKKELVTNNKKRKNKNKNKKKYLPNESKLANFSFSNEMELSETKIKAQSSA